MAGSIVPFEPAAFISGVVSHLAYFRIGEHHFYGVRYILTAITIFIFSILAQH